MIKAAVIIFNLIGYICIQASSFYTNGRGVYFIIVSLVGLCFSAAILLCYLWHIVEKYHSIKWLKIEMVGYAVLMFLNLVGATVAVAFGSAAFSAAGFFGYLAMVLYGIDAFLKYRALKTGEIAQGRRVIQQQQHITTPPALP
ncbi:CKLF-like MARVEL transmembrane domain-containing protein 4 [Phthorimaea operculella]|nr:CKLF-like MARVEL transmembrane domain-containing protein 4 [Phthorimaea operculella]